MLVLASAESFLLAVFGTRIAEVLPDLAAMRRILFSHEHTWIALAEGEVAGALLGYTGGEKAAEDFRTGMALLRILRWDMLRRMRRLLLVQKALGDLGMNELYVSNVAVHERFRGRGVGSALITHAEKEAARAGSAGLALDVETDNLQAIRLYERLGFRTRSRTRALKMDGRSFSFFRMEKALRSQ